MGNLVKSCSINVVVKMDNKEYKENYNQTVIDSLNKLSESYSNGTTSSIEVPEDIEELKE